MQFIFQVELHERESVIIFDEVQLQPMARQAIKHLVKDHRYDYIETGSLISVRSKSKNIIIPSEETKVNMYPQIFYTTLTTETKLLHKGNKSLTGWSKTVPVT